MALRLRNQNDPYQTLSLTNETWFRLLDLAEDFGWNPLGAVRPEQFNSLDYDLFGYNLTGPVYWFYDDEEEQEELLVLIEDSLNLADALEDAFLAYEPVQVPASYFLFEPVNGDFRIQPSIGALLAVVDFCRLGAFWIERYSRPE